MMKSLIIVAAALSFATAPAAVAAPCKDAKGRFTKCPKPAAGAIRCKDAKGRFAKCWLPGTHPIGE